MIKKKIIKTVSFIIGILILSAPVSAQPTGHSLQNVTCNTCHTCDVPTKQNPCLVQCPRTKIVSVHQPAEKTPDIIIIDKLADRYLPVEFSHKIHAQMSEMGGGCKSCHHYNTPGPVLECSACHSVERIRDDLSKPDLLAAYHRQCINCHKEWSGSSDCNSCHLPKGSTVAQKDRKIKDHPAVLEPEKLIYETDYDQGRIVTFFHNEHTKLFKLDCVSCHQQESCSRCHDKTRDIETISTPFPGTITRTGRQTHQPCFSCHENDECSSCHIDKPMSPFNHKTSTGWALGKFHEKLDCTKCHTMQANRFNKLNKDCLSCHQDFLSGSFNHDATGLKLDDMHVDFDCSDCHTNNNFSIKTDCSGCHDDLSYPKDVPGSLIKGKR